MFSLTWTDAWPRPVWISSHEKEIQSPILTNSRHSLDSSGEHGLNGRCRLLFSDRLRTSNSQLFNFILDPLNLNPFISNCLSIKVRRLITSLVTLAWPSARLKLLVWITTIACRDPSFVHRAQTAAKRKNTRRMILLHPQNQSWFLGSNRVSFLGFRFSLTRRGWWASIIVTTALTEYQHGNKPTDLGPSHEHDSRRRWKSRITTTRVSPFTSGWLIKSLVFSFPRIAIFLSEIFSF